jgi:hypothetical protein
LEPGRNWRKKRCKSCYVIRRSRVSLIASFVRGAGGGVMILAGMTLFGMALFSSMKNPSNLKGSFSLCRKVPSVGPTHLREIR